MYSGGTVNYYMCIIGESDCFLNKEWVYEPVSFVYFIGYLKTCFKDEIKSVKFMEIYGVFFKTD